MSAIWGAIDLNKKNITDDICRMDKPYEKCVIDRYETLKDDNVYMRCGIQYFTPEAEKEILPIREEDVFFAADVVLDNREELFERLEVKKAERNKIPDGTLLFWMYKKYGKACLNELRGVYSFVYYDRNKNVVDAVTDATGDRCLYYAYKDGVFYFGTLMNSIKTMQEEPQANERWLADFLGMDHLFMINELEETPLKEIYRIAPAEYVTIEHNNLLKKRYWNPLDHLKELKLKNDAEYQEQFCALWNQAVTDTMRSKDEISILLSGGMDSTAVACVAAPYLKGKNKILYSYTSVPIKEYVSGTSAYDVPDETEDVLKTKECLGNVPCEFVDMPDKNPWYSRKAELDAIEMPYKSVENFLWIAESMKMAYQNHSRLMLNGSYGNTTISFSDLEIYMNTLFSKGKWVSLWKELKSFQRRYGFSRKYALKKIIQEQRSLDNIRGNVCGKSFLSEDKRKSLGVETRICDMYTKMERQRKNYDTYREAMEDRKALRQIGEIATKHSLSTGVLLRDPTRDKRIIEFCISLPISQYIKKGEDRRLVRIYLADLVPGHILTYNRKGKQSADIVKRMELCWKEALKEWKGEYESHENNELVDCKKALKNLQDILDISKVGHFEITRHIYTLFVLEYLDGLSK